MVNALRINQDWLK